MNTLGQDREFTKEEVKFALDTVTLYKDQWEKIEDQNLKFDLEKKVEFQDYEKSYKESYEAKDIETLEKLAEEAGMPMDGQEPLGEDEKTAAMKKARFAAISKTFYDPEGFILH